MDTAVTNIGPKSQVTNQVIVLPEFAGAGKVSADQNIPVDEVIISSDIHKFESGKFLSSGKDFDPTSSLPPLVSTSAKTSSDPVRPPVAHATLYMPENSSSGKRIVKIPVDDIKEVLKFSDSQGKLHYLFTTGRHRELNKVDEKGNWEFTISMPDGANIIQFLHDDVHNNIYVSTKKTIFSLNAEDGSLKRSFDPQIVSNSRRILTRDDGGLIIAEGRNLLYLDENLKKKQGQIIGFEPQRLQYLKNGYLILKSPSRLMIIAPEGRLLLECKDIVKHSIVTDDVGKLWFIEKESDKKLNVVSFSPADNGTRRFKILDYDNSPLWSSPIDPQLIPLPDGRYIVTVDRWKKARLDLYSTEGERLRSFDMGNGICTKEFLLSKDYSHAYIVVDHNSNGSPGLWDLYRVDIGNSTGEGINLSRRLKNILGRREKIKPLYEKGGYGVSLNPVILKDGKILVREWETFSGEQVILISPDGAVERTFKGISEAAQFVSGKVNEDLIRIPVSDPEKEIRRDADIQSFADTFISGKFYGKNNKQGGPANQSKEENIPCFSSPDGCLNITSRLEQGEVSEALKEGGFASYGDYENLCRVILKDLIFDKKYETSDVRIPYGNNDGWCIRATRDVVEVIAPDGTIYDQLDHLKSHHSTAVLPVAVGSRHFVASADSAGSLKWYEVPPGDVNLSEFAMWDPVRHIAVVEGNKILAVSENGSFMVMKPCPGDKLIAPVISDYPHTATAENQSKEIIQDENVLDIRGIKLPVRRMRLIGSIFDDSV